MARCDELLSDPALLAGTDAIQRAKSSPQARQQFRNVSTALKDKIRSILPALKQASDSETNPDWMYHTAKLLVVDLERAELIGPPEELGGVFNMQYTPTGAQSPIVGPAAIAMHFLTEYLNHDPIGPHADEAALITRGVPFYASIKDLGAFPHNRSLGTKPVVIAYCVHSSDLDFTEIQPFFQESVESASHEFRSCLFMKEFGGFLAGPTNRTDYQSFCNEKALRSQNLMQVRFGVSPLGLESESHFTQALLSFLMRWHLPVSSEDLSYWTWSMHERADGLEQVVRQTVMGGKRSHLVEAYTKAKQAQLAALRARDREFSAQIRRELEAQPDALILTARGAHHRLTLNQELQLLGIKHCQFESYEVGMTQEARFLQAIQNGEGSVFRPTEAQEVLALRAVLANILRSRMDEVTAAPLHRGSKLSSSYKSTAASRIVDRWDDLAVERYFATPFARRGIFVLSWLMENATTEERPLFIGATNDTSGTVR